MPPLLATMVLAAVLLQKEWTATRNSERVSHLSALTIEIGDLVHELQKERDTSVVVLGGDGASFRGELTGQRELTETRLRPILAAHPRALLGSEVGMRIAAKLAVARGNLDLLDATRQGVDAATASAEDCFSSYTLAIAQLLDVVLEEGVAAQGRDARRQVFALFGLMQAKERASQERATGAQALNDGRFSPTEFALFRRVNDEEETFLQMFRSYADSAQRSELDRVLTDPASHDLEALRALAVRAGQQGDLNQLDRETWITTATRRLELLRTLETRLAGDLAVRAREQAAHARTWFDAILALLVVATGVLGVSCLRAGRSLSRPLRRMTDAMVSLAAGDNSITVPHLDRRDEVGAMAAAVEVFRGNALVRQEREQQIAHMARHDALTNLPNRAGFHERLGQAVAAARRGAKIAVLSIDLDRFGAVNESLGHVAGDQVLRAVAERLLGCMREVDVVARLGGDEFAVVQNDLHRLDDARVLADRIMELVAAPLVIEGQCITPELSIGIASAPLDSMDGATLMRCADLALQRAKSDGGRAYCFFEPGMEARQQARRALEIDLRAAIEAEAFELHYQPAVDARSTAITGFEALIRWRHPQRGPVSPAEFIPLAEETGLIVPLGRWIIERACADAAGWRKPLWVAVNISPAQFKDPTLVSFVAEAMRRHELPASRLELEITESVLMLDDDTTRAALHELHAMGVRIAMDDFGTGYSSLSYLRSFPFDKIKIDQSFIRGLGVAGHAEAIVQAITTLALNLGMTSTAEGVETPEQLAMLKAQGCDEIQGYLFSPAKPACEIDGLLGRSDPTFEHGRTLEHLLT